MYLGKICEIGPADTLYYTPDTRTPNFCWVPRSKPTPTRRCTQRFSLASPRAHSIHRVAVAFARGKSKRQWRRGDTV